MKDIKLDSAGDLDLTNNDLSIIDDVAQAIVVRLRWYKGEWKINKDYGVPYFDNVLGQKFINARIEADIFDVFKNVVGIDSVKAFDVTRNGRTLHVSFAVVANGNTETGEVEI